MFIKKYVGGVRRPFQFNRSLLVLRLCNLGRKESVLKKKGKERTIGICLGRKSRFFFGNI